MNITVSENATYCAHCGHIEPEYTAGNGSMVFVHKDDCKVMGNELAHGMFNALANAMTHMDANECLLRRAEGNIVSAMEPFAEKYLNDNSFFYKWANKDMTLKTKVT